MSLVGIFFYVEGQLLFHGCSLQEAETYGDFFVFNKSHFEIWDEYYFEKYRTDYDYYPRGRVIYDKTSRKYIIYIDPCIPEEMIKKFMLSSTESEIDYVLKEDEHYTCHLCNPNYINLAGLSKVLTVLF